MTTCASSRYSSSIIYSCVSSVYTFHGGAASAVPTCSLLNVGDISTTRSGTRPCCCCGDEILCVASLPPSASHARQDKQFLWLSLPVATHVIRPLLKVSPYFCRLQIDRMPVIKTASSSEKTATRAVGMDRSRIGRGREGGLRWSSTHRGMPALVCIPPLLLPVKHGRTPPTTPTPNSTRLIVLPAAVGRKLQYSSSRLAVCIIEPLVCVRYSCCPPRRPLFVLSRFAVFFHSDQSNNDWGFKLTSSACVSAPEELDEAKSEVRKRSAIPW